MSHNQKRTAWYKEGLISLLSGTTHGITSIIVGQPMDIVKTKMQAQNQFNNNKIKTKEIFLTIYKESGIKGFYKGASSPLIGSIMFRSIQFGVFESVFTFLSKNEILTSSIPYSFGVQPRVIIGAFFSGLVRSFVECPFEYAKVKKQTNQNWIFKDIYKGIGPLLVRTIGMNISVFVLIDSFRRNTNLMSNIYGQFIVGAFCCSLGWFIVWPFENLKNIVQAETKEIGKTWNDKFKWMLRKNGISGFYRGLIPGLLCVSTRNGASYIVMSQFQQFVTNLGFRK